MTRCLRDSGPSVSSHSCRSSLEVSVGLNGLQRKGLRGTRVKQLES